jgi:hypothetical protein
MVVCVREVTTERKKKENGDRDCFCSSVCGSLLRTKRCKH